MNRLPDPDLFRDAVFLAGNGLWTASELDSADALLVALVRLIKNSRRS